MSSTSICDSCHAGCCRAYRLIITIYDFLDLVAGQGTERAVQGVTFEALPFNAGYTSNKHMMYPFIFDNADKKGFMYSLALKRVESKLFPNTLMCNFLEEEQRLEPAVNSELRNHQNHPGSKYTARCSIYHDRPTMCRTYPIGLNPNTFTSVLKRRENLPQAATQEAYQICPKQELDLKDFGLEGSAAILKKNNDLLLNHVRTEAHNEAVLRWNSQPERLIEKVVPFMLSLGNASIGVYKEPQQNIQAPPIIQTTNQVQGAAQALQRTTLEQQSEPAQS